MEIVADPGITPQLRRQLIALWVQATNNGGAVGFLPPITASEIRPTANRLFRDITAETTHIVVAWERSDLIGWVTLELNSRPLVRHWAWLKRLMVLPSAQGQGIGRRLTAAAVALGRRLELEQLYLTCRSGTPLHDFYARLGWVDVGRMPGNLKLADGTYRDEIYMLFDVTTAQPL